MSALPRPDLPPGAHRELVDALHDLHHRAGWPSLRILARETGVSHTTVSKTFSSPTLPNWGTLHLLVEAMDGRTDTFRDLWLAASSPTSGRTAARSPHIAGRRSELAAVRAHLVSGTGLLLVTGEAGIGKSALVRAATACSGVVVLTGQCLPLSSHVPLAPVGGLLQGLWMLDDGGRVRKALEGCPQFVTAALGRLLPQLDVDGPGAVDDWTRQRLVLALRSLLDALAPVAMLIEDLHWADSATLDCLEQLIASRADLPVVGTWRLDDDDTSGINVDWLHRVRRAANVLALGPLTREETADQLALLLGVEEAERRVRAIHARSNGQPLFTEQLSAHLDDGTDFPPVLADLLDSRLRGLSGMEWEVARSLGIADRWLPVDVVAQVVEADPPDVVAALRSLAHRRLLADNGDQAGTVMLRHPLLAEGVRRLVVPGERELSHRRLAEALGRRPDAMPGEVAEHWRQAGDDAEELVWRVRAGEDATSRSAAAEASHHWLRAMEVLPVDSEGDGATSRFDMWVAALDALDLAGREDEAFEIALSLLGQEMSAQHRFELTSRAASFAWGQVGPDRALELLDSCGDGYEGPLPEALMVTTVPLRANLLAAAGRLDETLPILAAARNVARGTGDNVTEVRILTCSIWHHAAQGDLDAALAAAREVATVDGSSDPSREVRVAMMVTDALLTHARPSAEVEAAGRAALAILDEYDLPNARGNLVRSNVCESLIQGGHVARAAALLPAGVHESTDYTSWPLRLVAALIDVAHGNFQEALGLLDSDRQTDFEVSAAYAVPTAEILLWTGQADRAGADLMTLLEGSASSRATQFGTSALLTVVRAAADLAQVPRTREQGRLLAARAVGLRPRLGVDPLGPGPGARPVPGYRRAATAAWHAELMRVERADTPEIWATAAGEWDKITRPHDAAYCRWRAAQAALRDGQATLAIRMLKRAAADAREHVPLQRAIAATAASRR
jgi:hypothetical protein